jgi:hypothetical protein
MVTNVYGNGKSEDDANVYAYGNAEGKGMANVYINDEANVYGNDEIKGVAACRICSL